MFLVIDGETYQDKNDYDEQTPHKTANDISRSVATLHPVLAQHGIAHYVAFNQSLRFAESYALRLPDDSYGVYDLALHECRDVSG
jgi:hypothetical protein